MYKDPLGDRMKLYEARESQRRFLPMLPVLARLDGKTFSNFTKGLERPFDKRFSDLMIETTKFLVAGTGALVGYTQSDEISLLFHSDKPESQIFFDGKIQKMTSVLAGMAAAKFNSILPDFLPEKTGKLALFDCRVWQVPTKTEAVNAILWREMDAKKNSISMAARHYYSHKELHLKKASDMQEMLFEKGVNWNNYPAFFKRGTYVQRQKRMVSFSSEELARLPEKHEARQNPDLKIMRSIVTKLELPPLATVTNRTEVLFDGADPQTDKEQ